jgi:hypothetical protein
MASVWSGTSPTVCSRNPGADLRASKQGLERRWGPGSASPVGAKTEAPKPLRALQETLLSQYAGGLNSC